MSQNRLVCVRLASLVKYSEVRRLDDGIRQSIPFHAEQIEDLRSGEIAERHFRRSDSWTPSRLFPAPRTFIYPQPSETEIQSYGMRDALNRENLGNSGIEDNQFHICEFTQPDIQEGMKKPDHHTRTSYRQIHQTWHDRATGMDCCGFRNDIAGLNFQTFLQILLTTVFSISMIWKLLCKG